MSVSGAPTLGSLVGPRRPALALAAGLSIVSAACGLAPHVAVYLVALELFGAASVDTGYLVAVAGATAAALLVKAAAGAASGHLAHVAAYAALADVRRALVTTLDRIPLGRVAGRSAGELKKTLHDDVEQLEEALAHGVPDVAAAAAVPIATTVVLFAVDWRFALLALAALLVVVVVAGIAASMARASSAEQMASLAEVNTVVLGFLRGMKIVRTFRDRHTDDRLTAALDRAVRAGDAPLRGPARWLVSGMTAAMGLSVLLLLPTAGLGAVTGEVPLATLALFLLLGMGYATPLLAFVGTLATLGYRIRMASAGIGALLAEPDLAAPREPRSPVGGAVELVGVTFGYDADRPVLHDVDLEVPAGRVTALVGPTGAGKSTLARLVARFHDVTTGSVRVGGVDVREIDPAELARVVSVVQQDDHVFAASVLENIRIGRPEATDDEVVAAGRRARVEEFADALPQGWDTVVGDRLSGGQRQRISIARALLKASPVVVLDEATAFLDAENEAATAAAVRELAVGRTVLVIAHRLDTIAGADEVVVVDGGRVTARGPHETLLEDSARYRALWAAYQDAQGWTLDPAPAALPAPASVGMPGPVASGPPLASGDPDGRAWSAAAAAIVRPGLAALPFRRQWTALMGRWWLRLRRDGLVRLVAEGTLRGAPVAAVYLILAAVVDRTATASLVWWLTGGLAVLLVARVFANNAANQVVWRYATRAKVDLQLSLLDRLRSVPLGTLGRLDTGRIATTVTNDTVMLDFQNTPQQVAGAVIAPLYAAVVLLVVDWRLALATLAGIPLFLACTVWSDRIHRRVVAPLAEARALATTRLLDHVRGSAVLRAYPGSAVAGRYLEAVEELRRTSVALSVRATPAGALGAVALELGLVLLVLVGTALFTAGGVGAGTLLLFLVLSLVLYQPLGELAALTGYRRTQQQIARRIGEVWEEPTLPEPAVPAVPDGASVELRAVDFRYDADGAGLHGVSLRAEQGSVTALVGPSGAGKSTVANLVARFWDVDSGAVLLGGRDVRELGSAGVTDLVTTVFQDVYLFPGTVRENVALGRPGATDAELEAVLAAARCDFLVDGLDTRVGDGGADLSGGQRQRLSIARALLKDAPILVLDEAVAAVDAETEVQIQRALATLAAGRTVIVVAHRLSTVRGADRIVVLADGRVDGAGTHAELVDTSPVYRRLLAAGSPIPTGDPR